MEQQGNKKEYKAACRGCHGGCIHILTVEDGRLTGVRPDPDGPLNHGRACPKGVSVIEQMYHPDRLTYPLRRVGERGSGHWERITWDEAYDLIAEKVGALVRDHGPECVASFTGTGRHPTKHLTRFMNVLGSPNVCSTGALVCLGPRRTAGKYCAGVFAGVDYFGDVKPGGILVWGTSPDVSGPDGELQWYIKDAMKRDTPMVVVDPYPTEVAKRAKIWLRIRPGTDGALALGILNILISEDLYDHEFVDNWTLGFAELRARCAEYDLERVAEITTIPAEDILRAAHWIAETKPLGLEWGPAFEQSVNSFQTCRAIFMIPALTGNWDVPGGFVESMEISHIVPPLSERLPQEMAARVLRTGKRSRHNAPVAHPYELLDAMRTGKPYKIRALFAHANNTLLSMADSLHTYECLKNLDFFVYMDLFMTPTAELADLVLPAALWPEVDYVYCMPEFGDQAILCQQKVVQVGECKSDEQFFFDLCERMGLDYGAETQEEILNEILEEMGRRRPEYAGIKFEKFKEMGFIEPKRTYYNYRLRGGFNTPSGKFELLSMTAQEDGADPLPCWKEIPESPVSRPDLLEEYPLILTTGKRQQQYFISNNRQIASLRKAAPFPLVSIHPETAAKYGIAEGDWVFIETPRGKITQKAELRPEMDPNVINCEFGWWYPEDPSPLHGCFESNANVLTIGAPPYDVFGAYQMRGLLCRISRNPSKAIEERYYKSKYYRELPIDNSSACIVLDPNRCLLCGNCVETCKNVQTVGALEIVTRNGVTYVAPRGAETLAESACVGCGQCAASCPAQAIRVKSGVELFKSAVDDPDALVVVQVAPSVRVGVSEAFGLPRGTNVMPQLVESLYRLGADVVHDTVFSADLTVVEEAEEFLERLRAGEKLPLFTSCCPAWVRFCEKNYPTLSANISTTRSPQQMLAALLRDKYDSLEAMQGKKRVRLVSIMPCTAKKDELKRKESATRGHQDLDISLTTQELISLLREAGIDPVALPGRESASPCGEGSGGGVLFGVTGGVMESVLRYLSPTLGAAQLQAIAESGVRGEAGIRTFSIAFEGRELKFAVASGLGNARALTERVLAGEHFDLIEIMACPGGCVMGGGQPYDIYAKNRERAARTEGLFATDENSTWRSAADNRQVQQERGAMSAEQVHMLLHRNQDG